MKQSVVAGVAAAVVIAGVGTVYVVHETGSGSADATGGDVSPSPSAGETPPSASATPSTSPSASATPTTEPTPSASLTNESQQQPAATPSASLLTAASELRIRTGGIGPVRAGMTKQQALATGYFDADVKNENCDGSNPLQWKRGYRRSFDVLTTGNGAITSIGVLGRGPTTLSGLQVGSTYAEVSRVLGAKVTKRANDYGQAGLLINDGDAWIGFSFDADASSVSGSDRVGFIEVSRGRQPGLLRDGC